ncbi:hypothetical protein [Mucilaginibacter segetis]|uniref:Uncharacterized protein n=1 Tax=Mucilaginibacter segetis TaxID=2793071 RepID=A0A934PVW8_9SPHI|nr:hypothetical protein [Mucilaginibacter segetis]MBK0380622.1 hypothetical protein [Mucilaginibacter segetis]
MATDKKNPEFNNDADDRDRTLKDSLGETVDNEDLNYNEEENSYEYDVKGEDEDYDHPDPYDTAAKNGEDYNSTYDEANHYDVEGEYDSKRSIETDVDKLGMHIDNGKDVRVKPLDEKLAHTPEDDRDDLDEEGYPKNDKK